MKRHIMTAIAALAICAMANLSAAQGEVKPKETIVRKSVTGEVTGISSNFIAVTYGMSKDAQSALEMAFDLGKDIKIEHKKSLNEISAGDTVSVAYAEITRTDDEGKTVSSKRAAETIAFVRAAPKAVETNILDSSKEEVDE